MSTCTFFGSKNSPESVRPVLAQVLSELILKRGVNDFYVGNQGAFDAMVLRELRALAEEYPIRYTVVLAYHPKPADPDDPNPLLPGETLLPEEAVNCPPRFAIDKRNRWMLERADYVVACVVNPRGGAYKFTELARKARKTVIEVY
ncbi:MAG: hypothetical protein E7632_04765 [Ruminococcaceae bacterium]|nr:hypothetical protein [Oscillospiraceae bacterium]